MNFITNLQKSESFCIAPWANVHILPEGQIFPCCMTYPLGDFGSIAGSTIESALNSRGFKEIRKQFLAGEKPKVCNRCFSKELHGLPSYRNTMNTAMKDNFELVMDTKADGSIAKHKIFGFDIRFSNVCNFKCRTCGPQVSTSWHEDYVKLEPSYSLPKTLRLDSLSSEILKEVMGHLKSVKEIYFAGGEPLLHSEHWEILEELIKVGNREVVIKYSTNLSQLTFRKWDAIKLWSQFQNIYIYASVDGSYERGEYIRKGQNWQNTVNNYLKIRFFLPKLNLYILNTISILNAWHLPDFHREWIEHDFIYPSEFHFNFVTYPTYLSVQVLNKELKQSVQTKVEKFILDLKKLSFDDERLDTISANYKALVDFMNAEDKSAEVSRFVEMSKKIDKIRGEDLGKVFPELRSLLQDAAGNQREIEECK